VPREFVLRTASPLSGARLINPDAPLPPRPKASPPSVAPPPAPQESREDTTARLLAADRALIERTLNAASLAVAEALKRLRHDRDEWRRAAVELGVTLAARLLRDRVAAGDHPIEEIVREMIGQAGEVAVTVHLHPLDAELLRSRLGGKPLVEGADLRVVEEPTLARGDCRVETAEGFVLSRLAEQLEQMRARLLRSLADG
jgi:flagellar biosynthesis/type III secretory pathway protein FliH